MARKKQKPQSKRQAEMWAANQKRVEAERAHQERLKAYRQKTEPEIYSPPADEPVGEPADEPVPDVDPVDSEE